ncbi:MAG TPA: bifunctional pyr operon transcriptional regulator/uracil phosphoribosyltransferase PyrR [Phaeodactylibacter sp.]|nr:bifunctional pyr operon transcriptional regulator/uracil phosphoribosyltransferase PyrR [Phaeodactylibacter sp.]
MKKGKIILENERFELMVERLCHQLIEEYDDFENTCIVGVQPRGVLLADRIHHRLLSILKIKNIEYGKLDITFYRDDFRTRIKPLSANAIEMDFLVENKKVILVDDVLYSGRTIQAAMTALNHYGRPRQVELVALVDRRFNRHLPIQSDYIGVTVDAVDEAYVEVQWKEIDGKDRIVLYAKKEDRG